MRQRAGSALFIMRRGALERLRRFRRAIGRTQGPMSGQGRIAVLFVVALGAVAWAARQAEPPKPRVAWEYTWTQCTAGSLCNEAVQLGSRGWEMFAVTRHEEMQVNFRRVVVTCYFKRPKS